MAHRTVGEPAELRISSPLHIAVVSDDLLFCEGLTWLLRAETSFLSADAAVADIVLLDSNMSRALETCAQMSREARPPVIFVGAPDEDSWASQALGAGARGILTKSARPVEMVNAILAVHDGLIWARRRVMVARIDQLSGLKTVRRASEAAHGPRLSIREREVFLQAASGMGNKELADRLSISESTVKVHLSVPVLTESATGRQHPERRWIERLQLRRAGQQQERL